MWIYFILINIVAFFTMFIDKHKSKNNKWRIPEKRIWSLAILGGATGAAIGMYSFRHKTRHLTFAFFLPFLSLLHWLLISYLVINDINVINEVNQFIR